MKKLIVANWKCNPLKSQEALKIFKGTIAVASKSKKAETVICPPYVFLKEIIAAAKGTEIKIGAQNCFWEETGAYTGMVSAAMLKNMGCKYAIIGHSEARRFVKETNEEISRKIAAAAKSGLIPILCIGENRGERKENKTYEVLAQQLNEGLLKLSKIDISKIIIAYEPIWAIGTGDYADPIEIKKAKEFILGLLKKMSGAENTGKIRVIYGGSVNAENSELYFSKAEMDGLLVGGASLNPKEFSKIINSASY
ncbi:MAG: triose-phosphate isomerase [Candidatus Pacebacteria bacterium]|nr:triose-phosphate isomerase [Candidatus Paceibacterota bacterium]